MWLDAILAYLHYVAIFMLFAYLVAESMILKRPLDGAAIRRLGKIDLIYGAMAVLVLITRAWGIDRARGRGLRSIPYKGL